jgi:hypothetical protein
MQPFVLQNCCNLNMASWKEGTCAGEVLLAEANCMVESSALAALLRT